MHHRFLNKLTGFVPLFLAISIISNAQDSSHLDNLLEQINQKSKNEHLPVQATFKATRLGDGQSVKNLSAGVLDFKVSHRFGKLNKGFKNFFGLDNAVTKLDFDYGITDWLTIGIGRSTYEKQFSGIAKVRILHQTTDDYIPITVSYVGAIYLQTLQMPNLPNGDAYPFVNRLAYLNELLVARKFSDFFSLQLMLTHIHYNVVPNTADPNNLYAIGLGGRIKLTNRFALIGEYYYQLPEHKLSNYHNALSLGLSIETGGHVFQILFSNAAAINMPAALGKTNDKWFDGGIHFGFNLSRVFTLK